MENNMMINLEMPAVALRGLSIFPGMLIHFDLSRDKSVHAVEQAIVCGFTKG